MNDSKPESSLVVSEANPGESASPPIDIMKFADIFPFLSSLCNHVKIDIKHVHFRVEDNKYLYILVCHVVFKVCALSLVVSLSTHLLYSLLIVDVITCIRLSLWKVCHSIGIPLRLSTQIKFRQISRALWVRWIQNGVSFIISN